MATVSALVSGLDAELRRLGYKDSTLVWYRGCWRRMERFFAARGVEEFSLDVAMAWVDAACGFFDKERAGTLKPNDIYLFRVAQMLGDYALHGAVLRRYSRSVSKLDMEGADAVARFQAWLRSADRAVSTVRVYGTLAGEFVAFAGTHGGLARCDAETLQAFVGTLAGYQVKTVEQKLCAVRSFLRFASADGLIDATVLQAVPAVRSSKQVRVPSVWDPGDVARILDAIDRGNPCGKRDYAIIVLIARLGLRGVDVKRLEFADFDWPGNRLNVAQAKTGHRMQLPLLKEVGWAVIDYIRHGRPVCDCPQVFLRHTAPDRTVLRPGPSASDPAQARPGGSRAGERATPSRHALAATHPSHPVDGARHTGRTDRRHPRSPVGAVDGRVSEVVAGSVDHVRPGPGRAGAAGITMSADITMTDAITALVAQKRAVGYKYAAEERVLARFAAFCRSEFPGLGAPDHASVEAWLAAARQRAVTPATLQTLAAPVRELARWLGRRGVPAYVLPKGALPRPGRYVPHIYTDPELAALFTQTDRCRYCSQVPYRHWVMPVLFRTIYACGLRVSEARLLRVDDVDITTGVLQIRDAKGGKDRQAPVSTPLRVRLADYHAHVVGRAGGDWFFPGRAGRPLTLGNIDKNFRRFLWQARISHGGRGHGPRVHDLRHTFAVNNLRSWFTHGQDVGALLPVLQTYMGHSSLADTAYYLRLTAESYPDITARVQQSTGDVVPPVTAGPRRGD